MSMKTVLTAAALLIASAMPVLAAPAANELRTEDKDYTIEGQNSDNYDQMTTVAKSLMYFITDYIRAREGYHFATLAENYNLIRAMSRVEPYKDFVASADPANPQSNAATLGTEGVRTVQFKSLRFLSNHDAEVHFSILEKKTYKDDAKQYDKQLHIVFDLVPEMRLNAEEKFVNSAQFAVFKYELSDDKPAN